VAEQRSRPLWQSVVVVDLVVLAGVATVWLAWRLHHLLVLALAAAFIALVLDPVVRRLERRRVPRPLGALGVFVLVGILIGLVLAAIVVPAIGAGERFAAHVPSIVQRAEHGHGAIGRLLVHLDAQHFVTQNASRLEHYLERFGGGAVAVAEKVVSGLFDLVTVIVLAFFLLLEGPRLVRGFLSLFDERRARRAAELLHSVGRSVSGFVLGNLITSLVAGLVIWSTLDLLGVGYALALATWVGLVDLLPMIGGLLAGVPTTVFAFLHSTEAGIVTAIVFIVYQELENHLLNPLVMSRTVRLSPLWVLVAVLVGGYLYGFLGALLAIPVAGALGVLAVELRPAVAALLGGSPGPSSPGPSSPPGPSSAQAVVSSGGDHPSGEVEPDDACAADDPGSARKGGAVRSGWPRRGTPLAPVATPGKPAQAPRKVE
jgi:predicted PurR-regulated permease PerM